MGDIVSFIDITIEKGAKIRSLDPGNELLQRQRVSLTVGQVLLDLVGRRSGDLSS